MLFLKIPLRLPNFVSEVDVFKNKYQNMPRTRTWHFWGFSGRI